jgi:NSS family neurotransmitter:Na+ symporter
MVQYLIDRFNFSRLKASVSMGLFFYLIGILVILSGLDGTKEYLTWGGKNLFDWIDFITAAVMLPLGGLVMSIFVGYIMPKNEVEATLKPYLKNYFSIWYFSLRYIAPIALFIVILNLLGIM